DLVGLGQFFEAEVAGLGQLLLDDLVAEVDALVADVHARPGNELLDLLLALATERALEQVAGLAYAWSHWRHSLLRIGPGKLDWSGDGWTTAHGTARSRTVPAKPPEVR